MDADRRYASRKFILACAALLAGWVAFPFGLVDAGQVLEFTQWVLGLYFGANVVDDAATRLAARKGP